MAKKHFIYGDAAIAAIGDPASVTDLELNQTSQYINNGMPFSRVTCVGTYIGGEPVTIVVPGTIGNAPTPEQVAIHTQKLDFYKIKFTGLVLQVKGDAYDKITYLGVAEQATFAGMPLAPAK